MRPYLRGKMVKNKVEDVIPVGAFATLKMAESLVDG